MQGRAEARPDDSLFPSLGGVLEIFGPAFSPRDSATRKVEILNTSPAPTKR
ncbi:hypothetical protein ASZ90_016510 [hydrocarbon metagenome]|uniref:Uncharacterized protein n=1 Tax=hydrocarbon metagenome TaxID=938273 RepID=A0A0W8ER18_9ZZZZ